MAGAHSILRAGFVEPMLLLRTDRLPEGPEWTYEIKLDCPELPGRFYPRTRCIAVPSSDLKFKCSMVFINYTTTDRMNQFLPGLMA